MVSVNVNGYGPAVIKDPIVNERGCVLVTFTEWAGRPTRWVRADRIPGIEAFAASADLTLRRAFMLRWLADDLRQMGYEDGFIASMHDGPFARLKADDPLAGDRGGNVFFARTAGTPTQQMFHAMECFGSRSTIADRIGRHLAGKPVKGSARLEALADALIEAWDVERGRFTWSKVTAGTRARVGLREGQFRAPVTLPRLDVDPAFVVGEFFPEFVPFEEQIA